MYMIYTEGELLSQLRDGRIRPEQITERDVVHLVTILHKECYDEWTYNVENRGEYWKNLRFSYHADMDGENRGFTVSASNDYFEDRVLFTVSLEGDTGIEFANWMDMGMVEMIQDCFSLWLTEVDTRIRTTLETAFQKQEEKSIKERGDTVK